MSETTLFRFAKSDDAVSSQALRVREEPKQKKADPEGGSGSALGAAEQSYKSPARGGLRGQD